MKKLIAALMLVGLATPALAQTIARATIAPGGSRITAVVLSHRDDTITGATTPVADMVMAHTVQRMTNGTMMKPQSIPVEKNKLRVLSVYGYHLMLMGARQKLTAGMSFPLTVNFGSGKSVKTIVRVK